MPKRHQKVLDHRHLSPEPGVLESPCQTQALDLLWPHAGGILAEYFDHAGCRFQHP